ncbi:tetratricopeptide repeat protein [Desertibacillus haloalkaliphilus]|uniref:tetratricopeptide repeat protein n=1 Tax=Desertibacillus haloalkaliphilus TaxID=1328930 RepID=UPI001C2653BE|nr:tetratricopeptide repeat protein [Desertibacillus haloalkaliphilus]MBU8906711.1 tetratricopeptide repeat protein [Desertibacillus haloalkaliphilus]
MKHDIDLGNSRGRIVPFIQNGEYFFERGVIAYRKKDLKKAIQHLERATKLNPMEPVFHCQLAAVVAELGEYERSNEILMHVLADIDESIHECHFFMANNYAYLGLFEKAKQSALQYIESGDNGEFLEDTQDLLDLLDDEVDEDLHVETDQEDQLILKHEKASRYLEQQQYEKAEALLEEIIKEYPTFWAAYNHLAQALFLQGKTNEGLELAHEVLAQDEGNLYSRCNLVTFYHKIGKSEEVEQLTASLQAIYPLDVNQRFKVAAAFCTIGEYELAYERLRRLQPSALTDYVDFYRCMAVASFHTDREGKAQDYWDKASQLGDHDADKYLENLRQGTLAKSAVSYQL